MKQLLCALLLFCLSSLQGAWAQLEVPHQESEFVSGALTIKHGFRLGKTTRFPLPPGRWLVRVKEPVKSGHTAPQDGFVVWLEQSDRGQVDQLLTVHFYENRQMNWAEGSTCNVGLLSSPRGSSLSGGCFALVRQDFPIDAEGSPFVKLRAAWSRETLKPPGETLLFRGLADARDGLVAYFLQRMAVPPTAKSPVRVYLPRLRDQLPLTAAQQELTDWYKAYGQRVINEITGSSDPVDPIYLSALPTTLRNAALRVPDPAAPPVLAQALPQAGSPPAAADAQAERKK